MSKRSCATCEWDGYTCFLTDDKCSGCRPPSYKNWQETFEAKDERITTLEGSNAHLVREVKALTAASTEKDWEKERHVTYAEACRIVAKQAVEAECRRSEAYERDAAEIECPDCAEKDKHIAELTVEVKRQSDCRATRLLERDEVQERLSDALEYIVDLEAELKQAKESERGAMHAFTRSTPKLNAVAEERNALRECVGKKDKKIEELEAEKAQWRGHAMTADADGSLEHERAEKAEVHVKALEARLRTIASIGAEAGGCFTYPNDEECLANYQRDGGCDHCHRPGREIGMMCHRGEALKELKGIQ